MSNFALAMLFITICMVINVFYHVCKFLDEREELDDFVTEVSLTIICLLVMAFAFWI